MWLHTQHHISEVLLHCCMSFKLLHTQLYINEIWLHCYMSLKCDYTHNIISMKLDYTLVNISEVHHTTSYIRLWTYFTSWYSRTGTRVTQPSHTLVHQGCGGILHQRKRVQNKPSSATCRAINKYPLPLTGVQKSPRAAAAQPPPHPPTTTNTAYSAS